MLILSTGSQGEMRSALNRMAIGEHAHVQVEPGDAIIISGGTIPGNEEVVNRMLNALFERGAEVIYGPLADVHVSGHGSRDEMRTMIETVRPKFLLPVHGEARHRHLHRQLAQEAGMPADNVFLLRNGVPWLSDGETAHTGEALDLNEVYVDGRLVGEIGEIVLRDRKRLSQDGFIVTLIPVNERQQLVGEPQIISRGFVYLKESETLLKASRDAVKRHYRRGEHKLRKSLEDLFYTETHSRPVVIPQYIQVGG
jgi:ribonuclease J